MKINQLFTFALMMLVLGIGAVLGSSDVIAQERCKDGYKLFDGQCMKEDRADYLTCVKTFKSNESLVAITDTYTKRDNTVEMEGQLAVEGEAELNLPFRVRPKIGTEGKIQGEYDRTDGGTESDKSKMESGSSTFGFSNPAAEVLKEITQTCGDLVNKESIAIIDKKTEDNDKKIRDLREELARQAEEERIANENRAKAEEEEKERAKKSAEASRIRKIRRERLGLINQFAEK